MSCPNAFKDWVNGALSLLRDFRSSNSLTDDHSELYGELRTALENLPRTTNVKDIEDRTREFRGRIMQFCSMVEESAAEQIRSDEILARRMVDEQAQINEQIRSDAILAGNLMYSGMI